MKGIIVGQIALAISNFSLEQPAAVPERKQNEEFNLNKLSYRIDREPESWQGRGNRKKPRVK